MFSHIVIMWTDHDNPAAADEVLDGIKKFLMPIPGLIHISAGKMSASSRDVVDQSFQVGLNIVFPSKKAQEDYQAHAMHKEFVHTVFKKCVTKVRVYDFE